MLVICNGNAKAGLHVLVKTVELLGVPWDHTGRGKPDHCLSGHWPSSNPPPNGKHIHIIRHPKNMLVSWVRFTRSEFATGYLIAAFKSYFAGKPIYEEFMDYAPWLDDPEVLNIRFEALLADQEDQRIADFIGVPMLPEVSERRPGGTISWSGKLSHWPDYWSDEIEAAWQKARGPEIEKVFGYG